MRAISNLVVVSAAAGALLLSGCSGVDIEPVNLSDQKVVQAIPCPAVDSVKKFVDDRTDGDVTPPQKRELEKWGLTVDDSSQIESAKKALADRKTACENEQAPSVPEQEAAELCGKATVADCKTKGNEVYAQIPANRRNLKASNGFQSPAETKKELDGLAADQLSRASNAVALLVGWRDAIAALPKTPTQQNINEAQIVATIKSAFPGFVRKEVAVGTKEVNFKGAPEERGTAAFSQKTLKTSAQVGAFLRENTPDSRAAKARVAAGLKRMGYSDAELNRALTGTGYIPIQTRTASQILGTTYFRDGKVFEAGSWRAVGPNDVFWLYIASDGRMVKEATVRADCGNPDLKMVRPVRKDTPIVPKIEHPDNVCPEGTTYNPKTGTCDLPKKTTSPPTTPTQPSKTTPPPTTKTTPPTTKRTPSPKDPKQDSLVNTKLPPQVKGTAPPRSPEHRQTTRPSGPPSTKYTPPAPPSPPKTTRSTPPPPRQTVAPPPSTPEPSGDPCDVNPDLC